MTQDVERIAAIKYIEDHTKKLREWINNAQIVVDLMKPQMDAFNAGSGHNVYAVRMAVDHMSNIRTDAKLADALDIVLAHITKDTHNDTDV